MKKIRIAAPLFLVLFVLLIGPVAGHAAIFPGSGDQIGLCLNNPGLDECAGIDCTNPAVFGTDERCISEAQVGTGLAEDSLNPTGITHTDNFGDLVLKFVNFSLPYLTLACFIGFVVAGFFYVTAFGNEEQLTKAKRILVWSVIGILIVIGAYAIVQFLTTGLLLSL